MKHQAEQVLAKTRGYIETEVTLEANPSANTHKAVFLRLCIHMLVLDFKPGYNCFQNRRRVIQNYANISHLHHAYSAITLIPTIDTTYIQIYLNTSH
jgi:hypothetical protein